MRKVTEAAVLPKTDGIGIFPNKLDDTSAIVIHVGTPEEGWEGLDPNLLAMPAYTIYTGEANQYNTPLISKKCGSLYLPLEPNKAKIFEELESYLEDFESSPALPQMKAFIASLQAEARKNVTHHIPVFELTGDPVKESVEHKGERYTKIDSMEATHKAGKGRFTTAFVKSSLVTQFNNNFYKNAQYCKKYIDPTSGGGGEYGCFFPQRFPVGEIKKTVENKRTSYSWTVNASPNFLYCSQDFYEAVVAPHILSIYDDYLKLVEENEASDEYESAIDYCKAQIKSMDRAASKKPSQTSKKHTKPVEKEEDEEEDEDFGSNED